MLTKDVTIVDQWAKIIEQANSVVSKSPSGCLQTELTLTVFNLNIQTSSLLTLLRGGARMISVCVCVCVGGGGGKGSI